ncbi:hypothetical protein HWV62_3078 [Athelia sp. TMB]|nr:hypothetical protein HWV62_3078 [Athelia sp. TMB]
MAARSAGILNPASMPFFPGSVHASSEDERGGIGGGTSNGVFGQPNLGFRVPNLRQNEDRVSESSTVSVSPTEYKSMRSSPSPSSLDERDRERNPREGIRFQPSPSPSRASPAFRQVDADRAYPVIESGRRELSTMGSLETLPEDTPPPVSSHNGVTGSPFFQNSVPQALRERHSTPPVTANNGSSRSSSFNTNVFNTTGGFTSSSPVSSTGSQFAPSSDNSLEAQLKALPLIHDILDRLVRCEYSTREIQRDLGDVHRKVNLLVERSLHGSGMNSNNLKPEFKDPFSPAANSFSPAMNGPRGSFSGVAPNQPAPSDDIGQISQRLNTLTTSVGQLLALQTQQHIQAANAGLSNGPMMMNSNLSQQDLAPNQLVSSSAQNNMQNNASLGLPNRPDIRGSLQPRAPNPPMRTWSAGTLDLPMRPSETGSLGRANGMDKRRSVVGGLSGGPLMRRESVGVLDTQGGEWAGGSPRDNGPIISKWEQLSLAPDLLRSLSKFGVGPPNKIQQRALPFLLRGSDIIAQAPPTQERIAAYVIPAIQTAVVHAVGRPTVRGPSVIMISTTVDQATQAQRMIRDLGGPIGVRSALGVGASPSNGDQITQELRLLQQNMPHIICGTPQKLHALFTSPGGLSGAEVRFLVLDEVDQLIARNLHEFVFNIVKLLPPPRSRTLSGGTPGIPTPGSASQSSFSFETTSSPSSLSTPFLPQRRYSGVGPPGSPNPDGQSNGSSIERQTALFSNTVPQDVLNLASAIQLREPVRVLVRRDGNVTQADTNQGSRGLRQFYLYLAFTAGGRTDPASASPAAVAGLGIIGSGRGATNAETTQAREWKLEALADLFDDVEVTQAIVHVGGMTALDSVVYKLASRGLEAVPLHGDMNAGTKLAALNKFRTSTSVIIRQPVTKVLVVYDVQVKTPEVAHAPLIINYDLPKAVEEYAHRVAPAIASNYSRAGVVVNFVTATGGDVEMLRSIECFYKIKCPEVPISLRDIV